MMVLVIGTDEHGIHVRDALRERGCDAIAVDSAEFPRKVRISFDPCAGDGTIHLSYGRNIAWSDIESVYWRSYDAPLVMDLPNRDQTALAENEHFGMSLESDMMIAKSFITFQATGSGTRVISENTVEGKGVFWRSVLRLSRDEIVARQQADLEKLKALVEAG